MFERYWRILEIDRRNITGDLIDKTDIGHYEYYVVYRQGFFNPTPVIEIYHSRLELVNAIRRMPHRRRVYSSFEDTDISLLERAIHSRSQTKKDGK